MQNETHFWEMGHYSSDPNEDIGHQALVDQVRAHARDFVLGGDFVLFVWSEENQPKMLMTINGAHQERHQKVQDCLDGINYLLGQLAEIKEKAERQDKEAGQDQ